jgi:hypothetical protein
MKRVSKKSLEKLSITELKLLLQEKQEEKKYFMSMNKTNRYSGKINTIENQIALIKENITAS